MEQILYTYFLECSAENKRVPPSDSVQVKALRVALAQSAMNMDTFRTLFFCLLDNPQEFESVMQAVVEKLKQAADEQHNDGSGRSSR